MDLSEGDLNLDEMFQSKDVSALTYAVDMGKKTTDEIVDWLEEFQQRISVESL
jgi:hypothetical protein